MNRGNDMRGKVIFYDLDRIMRDGAAAGAIWSKQLR